MRNLALWVLTLYPMFVDRKRRFTQLGPAQIDNQTRQNPKNLVQPKDKNSEVPRYSNRKFVTRFVPLRIVRDQTAFFKTKQPFLIIRGPLYPKSLCCVILVKCQTLRTCLSLIHSHFVRKTSHLKALWSKMEDLNKNAWEHGVAPCFTPSSMKKILGWKKKWGEKNFERSGWHETSRNAQKSENGKNFLEVGGSCHGQTTRRTDNMQSDK